MSKAKKGSASTKENLASKRRVFFEEDGNLGKWRPRSKVIESKREDKYKKNYLYEEE